MLEKYGHGGDLDTAEKLYDRPRETFVDFSSNMNPWGPPAAAKEAMLRAWERIDAYPDPAARRLRAALAARHGVEPEAIWVGNGAAEAIDLSLRSIRPSVAAVTAPGFAEYETAVLHAEGRVHKLRLLEEREFQLTGDDVASAAAAADTIVIGHPNNPTGRLVQPSVLQKAVESFRAAVIDEAFLDFAPDEEERTLIKHAAERENLFVVRSLTKFYSIPGLRLGYVVAHPESIRGIRELAVPWSANGIALEVGEAVLSDREFAKRTIGWLAEEREWLSGRLRELGVRVYPSDVNFLLIRFPHESGYRAGEAQTALGREGVLIRNAATFNGLDDTYVRVAVKRREANERLARALEGWMLGEKVRA